MPSPTFAMKLQRLWQGYGFTTGFAKPLPSLLSKKPYPKPHLCHRLSIPINPLAKPTFPKPHLYHLIMMHSLAINGKGDKTIRNSRGNFDPQFPSFFHYSIFRIRQLNVVPIRATAPVVSLFSARFCRSRLLRRSPASVHHGRWQRWTPDSPH